MLSFGVELDLHTQVHQVSLSRDRWQPHRRAGEPGPPRLHRTPSALLSCSLRPHRHPPVLEQATTLPARAFAHPALSPGSCLLILEVQWKCHFFRGAFLEPTDQVPGPPRPPPAAHALHYPVLLFCSAYSCGK